MSTERKRAPLVGWQQACSGRPLGPAGGPDRQHSENSSRSLAPCARRRKGILLENTDRAAVLVQAPPPRSYCTRQGDVGLAKGLA